MWKYVKKYIPLAIIAMFLMIGEVLVDLTQPKFMSQIVDNGVLGINNFGIGSLDLILKLGFIMILVVVIGGFCGSMNNVVVNFVTQKIGNQIRKDAFKKIMTFSWNQIDDFSTGSLVTRITNDVSQIEKYLSIFVRGLIRTLMLTFGSIYFMFVLNYNFGKTILFFVPFMLACIFICLKKATPYFTKLQNDLDKINDIMQEDISGIRIIKACVREISEKIRFGTANNELIKTQLKVLVIFAFMNPIVNIMIYIVIALIIKSGANQVILGSTTPGNVMASVTYCTQLLHGILMFVMLFQNISRGNASWQRIKEVLYANIDIEDGSFSKETKTKGKIEFKNVSFKYGDNNKNILNHISFTINPGETIGIMGSTGCGKSTLVNLIPRFYDVTDGEILIDDINVKEYNQEILRDKIAIVLQKSELFSESIKDNISWGKKNASLEKIEESARIAQANDFIDNTENKYDTMIAERGMSLSGGQKQRISIARAILKSPEILIFDDSTSALDLKTEADLYNELKRKCPDTTKIIIAQRIASVRQADKILVMSNGEIVDSGSHDELMRTSEIYQDIYYSQNSKEGDK